MPQAASLGPQHRSDAMKKGVGDRLEVGQVERRQEEADELGESEQDLGARAAEDREQRPLLPCLAGGDPDAM